MQNPFSQWPFANWPPGGEANPWQDAMKAWTTGAWRPQTASADPMSGLQSMLSAFWQAPGAATGAAGEGAGEWSQAGNRMTAALQKQWQDWIDNLGRWVQGAEGVASIWGVQRAVEERAAPLGATREYVRQMQDYAATQAELLPALKALHQTLASFPASLQEKLAALAEARRNQNQPITSLRGMVDFWIDGAEEAFADIAHSEAFSAALGKLTNVLSRLKIQRQRMLDQQLEVLGLPTRAELRTSHERLQQARRDIRALKHEVAALRALVSAQTEGGAKSEAPAAGTRKASAKTARKATGSAGKATKKTARKARSASKPTPKN